MINFSINPANRTLNLLITLDNVVLKGKYNMNLRLGLLLVDGDGDSTLDLSKFQKYISRTNI